ncbi:MAG: ABC transporter substrate-binding protein [Rhodospirillales bacterium]
MTKTVTFACWDYDRVLPVLEGKVLVPGFEIAPVILKPSDLFPRTLRNQEFDISELSFSSYLYQCSQGTSQYIAIPVFTSRAFRHSCVYVRADAGINSPKDLEGRKVGIPEYQMTLVVWARGMLQDEYGVDFKKMKYRTGATNYAGLKERLPLKLPDDIDINSIPSDKSTSDMLLEGKLDAIISPNTPDPFVEGNPKIKYLLDDIPAAEEAYFKNTGIFPIMHTVVIKKSVAEENPELAVNLFNALVEAKQQTYKRLQTLADLPAIKITLPWYPAELARTKSIMGEDYWAYGIEKNRNAIESMLRYSHEQYLSKEPLKIEDIFVKETLDLAGV